MLVTPESKYELPYASSCGLVRSDTMQ